MRHNPLLSLLAPALLVAFAAQPALAWNSTGHETVALIAWHQLSPTAKANISTLLKAHPDYTRTFIRETTPAGEERDAEAFATAATWPDLIRSTTFGKSHLLEHSNWHYADMPYVMGDVKPTEEPPVLEWSKGVEPTNAVQALKKSLTDLKDPELHDQERSIALCWLEHLVGDIHQPLHATSRFTPDLPTGDRGGNSFTVSSDGQVTNLHSLWDGLLGGVMDLSKVKQNAEKLQTLHPKKEFEKEIADLNFDDWAHTSYDQAKTYAYLDGKIPGLVKTGSSRAKTTTPVPELPPGYIARSTALAGRNAALAGYRLAALLEPIFGDKKP